MPISKALQSLEGLATGDAFGAAHGEFSRAEMSTALPPPPWRWTDDTHMATSIVEILSEHGQIEQDALATRFGERFVREPFRGYAFQATLVLGRIASGGDWREAAVMNFPEGSYGNGAAMRAAPIGAFFAGHPDRAANQAELSAVITHAHPEGRAGARAVAAAAAITASDAGLDGNEYIDAVIGYVPDSVTKDRLVSSKLFLSENVADAAEDLGTGWGVSAQDTVPFCVWMASRYSGSCETAMWRTAAVSGDRDTTCAIVGGIVASGPHEIPAEWLERREPVSVQISSD